MKSVADLVNQLVLKDKHIDVLRKTPFWLVIDACRNKKLEGSVCEKKDDFIEKIIASYSGKGCFKIGGKIIKLVKEEVKLIFGIQCGEERMEVIYASKQDIDFVKRNKLKGAKLTATTIKKMILTKANSSRKQDVEDVARLVCMFLCVSLFFPTSGSTLSWSHVSILDDLEEMKNYDWANAILKYLLRSIKIHHKKEPRKVIGCVYILLVRLL